MPDPNDYHDTHHERPPASTPPPGELHCGGSRIPLHGRAFQLALWIARHQPRINAAADAGQLTLHWKGADTLSIAGEIRTRL